MSMEFSLFVVVGEENGITVDGTCPWNLRAHSELVEKYLRGGDDGRGVLIVDEFHWSLRK